MPETGQCPQCGAKLPPDAPPGVCPKCLLGLGFGSEPDDAPALAATAAPTPPGRFVAPQPAELAAHFPQLEILELLGQGGMGAVYKARQRQLHRLVALKILPPEVARDPAFAERFQREAQALAQLSHPQIVSVFDSGRANGLYYFVMEFVDGVNLRRMLAEGKLSPPAALAIVPQVCEALQYAHDEGIVHRDIKPENILLDKKGRVKIADFGLARLVGQSRPDITLTGTQQVMGTPHYMAPEQMERPQTVDHRADIYSLGVVFYEMLTGELPLGRFQPPSKKAVLDVRLDEVVLRSLEKEPELRYQRASTVKTDLERIAAQPGEHAPPLPPKPVAPSLGGESPFADVQAAKDQVRLPAIGLIVVGSIQCALFGLVLLIGLLGFGFFFARAVPSKEHYQPPIRSDEAYETVPEETMQLQHMGTTQEVPLPAPVSVPAHEANEAPLGEPAP
jgi:serine/threonine protein kinase